MRSYIKVKAPTEVLDYVFNAGHWLASGDTISTKSVASTPSGLTVNSSSIVAGTDLTGATVASGAVLVWLASGTDDITYTVDCTVTTAGGRTKILRGKLRVEATS